jgi:spermidine/putrescine transport system permease protein
MVKQSRSKGFAVRRQPGFGTIAIFCFILLYMPIATLVVYSFNAGTSIAIWEGFSWRWYQSAWHNEQVQEVSLRSLLIASIAAFVSTICATMAALATTRTRHFPGLTFIYAFINQPLVVPEIVTGVACLSSSP